jgi:hypothetical protein
LGTYNVAGHSDQWIFTVGKNFGVTKNGELYASGGEIGGFKINSDLKVGLYSDYLILNPNQVYFPVQAHLNLNDKVKIYSATPPGGSQTSYIATLNDTDFIIQNQSGAGIKFAREDTTTNVDIKLTVTLSSPTYIYENKTPLNSWGVQISGVSRLYSVYLNYTATLNQPLSYPLNFTIEIPWTRTSYYPNYETLGSTGTFTVSGTIQAYTTSITSNERVY